MQYVWTEIEISGFSLYAQSKLWTLSKLFDWMINIEAAARKTQKMNLVVKIFLKVKLSYLMATLFEFPARN